MSNIHCMSQLSSLFMSRETVYVVSFFIYLLFIIDFF